MNAKRHVELDIVQVASLLLMSVVAVLYPDLVMAYLPIVIVFVGSAVLTVVFVKIWNRWFRREQ